MFWFTNGGFGRLVCFFAEEDLMHFEWDDSGMEQFGKLLLHAYGMEWNLTFIAATMNFNL